MTCPPFVTFFLEQGATMKLLLALLVTSTVKGFTPTWSTAQQEYRSTTELFSSTATTDVSIEPKDAVRLFGRLAEKYIMLDETGGMCCYSACKDCEYRLPDGGYRMADQSASRPKWIPVYEERSFASQDKEHKSKWSTDIFTNGPAVSKEEFIKTVAEMSYVPPLGGPFVGGSAGQIEDTTAVERLFDILADGKEKLARHKMSVRLKELAGGEEGLTWPSFSAALGL
eukprot:scaffold8136_cov127-Cylindrotheca_fusiformis.AAC.4